MLKIFAHIPRSISSGTGLLKFCFERQKIEEIYLQYFKEKTNGAYTIQETARKLHIGSNTTGLLIKSNLLHIEVVAGFESLGHLVTAKALNTFNRTYIFARYITPELTTQHSYITKLPAERNIYPAGAYENR